MSLKFLSLKKGKILADKKEIRLRGINFGGWLMMEGYILGGRNVPEKYFHRQLQNTLGKTRAEKFKWEFRDHFIQESDIKNVAKMGFNVVRVPINYRLLRDEKGWKYLDRTFKLFEKHNIYCILDMHGAPGCQNADWHSDSFGDTGLFNSKYHQQCLVSLWKKIALRYKNLSVIAGYDILNEAVTHKVKVLNKLYHKIIQTIRATGDNHIIFLEGNQWTADIECLDEYPYENIVYSVHYYSPIHVTFNLMPHLIYPGVIEGEMWNKAKLKKDLVRYRDFAKKRNSAILVGEFGVAMNCQACKQELKWVQDAVDVFEELKLHWTYWTYKTLLNTCLPSGLYRFLDEIPWIGRIGPLPGWESFPWFVKQSKEYKQQLLNALETKSFVKNKTLADILSNAIRKNRG